MNDLKPPPYHLTTALLYLLLHNLQLFLNLLLHLVSRCDNLLA